MGKILLMTIGMIGYCFVSFSQSIDSLKDKDSFKDQKVDSLQFSEENLGINEKTKEIFKQQKQVNNMPIYKPKGNFTMPIYEPDSTKSYTLLIK